MRRAVWVATALLVCSSGIAHAERCPNMLIVLDRSFSMRLSGKLDAARQAIAAFTPTRDSVMRFGAMIFPAMGSTCGPGQMLVACDLYNADPINAALAPLYPGGETPTADALGSAAQSTDMTDTTRRRFIILLTDGDPTCPVVNNPDASLVPAVQQVQALYAAGVTTFVIGFGSAVTPARLDQLAAAGGAPRPNGTCTNPAGAGTIPCKYYEASDQPTLQAAFDQIAAVAVGELQGSTCDDSCYFAGGCPAGQRCVQSVHITTTLPPITFNPGTCAPDPCATVTCGTDQFCREGICVAACLTSCQVGQVCSNGACVADPCAANPASCACAGGCAQNLVCLAGACKDDPCRYIGCPSQAPFCSQGNCYAGPPAPKSDGAPGSGGSGSGGSGGGTGCTCANSGAALLPVLALLPWAMRTRRRRAAAAAAGALPGRRR